ncbi:MAG: hypothetical protein OEZ04_09495 [Nitrospinota bacterium]|nr:hypothetical protein [Nitrospinota bacterium]
MNEVKSKAPLWVKVVSVFAVIFGVMTLISGGSVLFIDSARRGAGAYVPFVTWFNFIAGLVYIIAGAGIWKLQKWSGQLSIFLAVSTLLVFIAFGIHIIYGGSYEMRTVAAMTLRFSVWAAISYFVCGLIGCGRKPTAT